MKLKATVVSTANFIVIMANKFGYMDLEDEVKKPGYISWDQLSFRIPGVRSNNGYKVI
ncbi:conserved hypothetical protein [Ricinus communis]|uniref:Uncharacterized protein n=1 Tax=Ricinus communis TaxID=3988 RepID=B9S7F8_RICCO|nr:conserved hypothetical protein [Ricinus communis]